MSLHVPRIETEAENSALRQRALRFAGVRLGGSMSAAKPRPELVVQVSAEDRLAARMSRFVYRSGNRI